jgi:hypothetical protein
MKKRGKGSLNAVVSLVPKLPAGRQNAAVPESVSILTETSQVFDDGIYDWVSQRTGFEFRPGVIPNGTRIRINVSRLTFRLISETAVEQ